MEQDVYSLENTRNVSVLCSEMRSHER